MRHVEINRPTKLHIKIFVGNIQQVTAMQRDQRCRIDTWGAAKADAIQVGLKFHCNPGFAISATIGSHHGQERFAVQLSPTHAQ